MLSIFFLLCILPRLINSADTSSSSSVSNEPSLEIPQRILHDIHLFPIGFSIINDHSTTNYDILNVPACYLVALRTMYTLSKLPASDAMPTYIFDNGANHQYNGCRLIFRATMHDNMRYTLTNHQASVALVLAVRSLTANNGLFETKPISFKIQGVVIGALKFYDGRRAQQPLDALPGAANLIANIQHSASAEGIPAEEFREMLSLQPSMAELAQWVSAALNGQPWRPASSAAGPSTPTDPDSVSAPSSSSSSSPQPFSPYRLRYKAAPYHTSTGGRDEVIKLGPKKLLDALLITLLYISGQEANSVVDHAFQIAVDAPGIGVPNRPDIGNVYAYFSPVGMRNSMERRILGVKWKNVAKLCYMAGKEFIETRTFEESRMRITRGEAVGSILKGSITVEPKIE